MQGSGLLSDMQSFRAANPGCILEDFVRWHSPKDWRPSTVEGFPKGALSKRMRNPANLWQQLWKQAEPIPALKQKPLFDAQAEGEQILNWLENIKPAELFNQLLGIALGNIFCLFSRVSRSLSSYPSLHIPLIRLHHTLHSPHVSSSLSSDLCVLENHCALIVLLEQYFQAEQVEQLCTQQNKQNKIQLTTKIQRTHVQKAFNIATEKHNTTTTSNTKPKTKAEQKNNQSEPTENDEASLPLPDAIEFTVFAPTRKLPLHVSFVLLLSCCLLTLLYCCACLCVFAYVFVRLCVSIYLFFVLFVFSGFSSGLSSFRSLFSFVCLLCVCCVCFCLLLDGCFGSRVHAHIESGQFRLATAQLQAQ